MELARKDDKVVQALILRLFPAASQHLTNTSYGPERLSEWLTARRVAHPDILKLYLEWQAGEGLSAFTDAERAFSLLQDETALDTFLRSIDLDRLEDVIAALENYEGRYPIKGVPVATIVLLNLLPILPEKSRGMFGADARIIVTRVVLRLLRQLPGAEEIERTVSEVLPKLQTLSSRFQLILLVGHRENTGHKLISEPAAAAIEEELVVEVGSARITALLQERDLFILAHWVQQLLPDGELVLPALDNLDLNANILTGALTEVRSQDHDSRVVTRKRRLQWDMLTDLYGGEEVNIQVPELGVAVSNRGLRSSVGRGVAVVGERGFGDDCGL